VAGEALRRRGAAEARRSAGIGAAAPAARRHLAAAAWIAPLSPEARLALAAHDGRAGDGAAARHEVRAALRLAPLAPEALALAGSLAAAAGDGSAGAYQEQAAASDPFSPQRRTALAAWRLARGDRAGGLAELARAMALGPGGVSPALTVAALYRVPLSELAALVPPRADALRAFARAADAAGEAELATEARRRADGQR